MITKITKLQETKLDSAKILRAQIASKLSNSGFEIDTNEEEIRVDVLFMNK